MGTDEICDYLNELLVIDKYAVTKLFKTPIRCNDELAEKIKPFYIQINNKYIEFYCVLKALLCSHGEPPMSLIFDENWAIDSFVPPRVAPGLF